MGTWTLWIAFNAGVALFLLLDLVLFHHRGHVITLLEAALESLAWVSLSVGFGFWIFFSHGSGPGLEFFTGYLIEKSLSVDNVFLFMLIFQFFRVDSRYQHRLLFWGVLGALILRGAMIGVGTVLIHRFDWILYLFGAFLLYAGFKLFSAEPSVHPDKNPVLRWAQKVLPMSRTGAGPKLFVRENGHWLATRLLLVVLVLETTDLFFAVDSIPAVFGVTRDPFLVYSSNVCAILGLRAFYFLLVGILPYFRYLDEGLAVVLMFIGAKMLAEPWVHISTGLSLMIVGGVIGIAAVASVLVVKFRGNADERLGQSSDAKVDKAPMPTNIENLAEPDETLRLQAAQFLFSEGTGRIAGWIGELQKDEEFPALLVLERFERPNGNPLPLPRLTVGVAVSPRTFENIRAANGSPPLAAVSSDQDVIEIELEFHRTPEPAIRLDILTTKAPGGGGAIARYLEKFGEGIQQVEIDVTDVDRATQIMRERFKLEPIFSATRPGAGGTRINFFLVPLHDGKKVLVELVQQPK